MFAYFLCYFHIGVHTNGKKKMERNLKSFLLRCNLFVFDFIFTTCVLVMIYEALYIKV